MIRYARLVPVEASDPLMVVSHTREPLALALPTWSGEDAMPPAQRLVAMQKEHGEPVYPHKLTPLIPSSLRATPLPARVWDTDLPLNERRVLWQTHLAADHYAPWAGGDQSVVERLEGTDDAEDILFDETELGIFGNRVNPLDSVLAFMNAIGETNMLLHYIAVVSLQYYVIKRGGFMRVRTDAKATGFSDALPPYLWLYFRKDEARMPKLDDTDAVPLMQTGKEAAAMARAHSFPFFLLQVFRWIKRAYDDDFMCSDVLVLCFCQSKIAKNTIQSMMCMRFRHVMPTGFAEALAASRPADTHPPLITTNKCFSASIPNLGQMLILSRKAAWVDECVPFVFCHHLFQPDTPILAETRDESNIIHGLGAPSPEAVVDAERKLLWKLMCFLPMQEFGVAVSKLCIRRWTELLGGAAPPPPLFPKDHRDKLMQYDAYQPMLRPFYMSYVMDKESMFVYVPRMHWPTNLTLDELHLVPMPDDADLRWMTPEAWDWCVNRGRVFAGPDDVVKAALAAGRVARHAPGYELAPGLWGPVRKGWTPWTAWLVRTELAKPAQAPRDAFVYMKTVQLLTGVEEDGIATVARGLGQATYAELRSLSERVTLHGIEDAHRLIGGAQDDGERAFVSALHVGLATWDRCSVLPFPPGLQRTVMRDRLWDLYFQPSRVGVDGGVPWIERFHRPSPCAGIRTLMARVYGQLQTDKIRAEIKQCEAPGGYDDLPKEYHQAWTMLLMLLSHAEATPPPAAKRARLTK